MNYTCYNKKNLHLIKNSWNAYYPNNQILTNNNKKIWNFLQKNLLSKCNNEKCWLKQDFITNKINHNFDKYTFAPKSPESWEKNPTEWLSSVDIIKIMQQYEYQYPSFKFIGPSPIDFDHRKSFGQCVWNDLCNLDIKKLYNNNITKIGIILNTDTHDLDGSHWICAYIDLKKKFVFSFDSNADKHPKEKHNLFKKILQQALSINIKLEFIKNTMEHQKSNTECGMYCLFTIIQLLTNKMKLIDFNKRIPDKLMIKMRKTIFNQL